MIVCAGLVFWVGSASANSHRQEAEASYSTTPDKCELERCAAAISNSSIAYLTSTMHDG
jgi:hypothetical protein